MRRLPRTWRQVAERPASYVVGAAVFVLAEVLAEAVSGWDPYRLISVAASSIAFWALVWYLVHWLLNRPPGGRRGGYA